MTFLLSELGQTNGTSAAVMPVNKLTAVTALPFSLFRCYGVDYHFVGLLEKVHRPPKYLEALRLQVAIQVLPGIPFFKNAKFIFIFHTLTKVAA